jgi:branched-chain amino acid transport system permease protein
LILEATRLNKSFGGLQAVKDASVAIRPGQVTGIIGPNGAGKSTVFNLITGFLKPDSGEVVYKGQDITGLPPYAVVLLGLGRTFQDLRLFGRLTVLDNVMLARPGQMGARPVTLFARWLATNRDERAHRDRALEIVDFVGLADKANALADNLSYGQQKRVAIARVLALEADTLMLDEPASGLDPEAVRSVNGLIRDLVDLGKTICVVEHDLDTVREVCDRVIAMDQGEILVEGTPEEVLADERLLEAYLGV